MSRNSSNNRIDATLVVYQLKVDTPRVKPSGIVDVVPELQGFTAYDVEHFLCMNHEKI